LSRSDGCSGLVVLTPERKVRAPQDMVLPNRKIFALQIMESAAENIPPSGKGEMVV